MDLNLYKEKLKDYLISYHKINVNKLFKCLNPDHEDRHPSMGYSSKYNFCKCFGCGVTYDIFDIIKIDYGCESFKEQLNKIREIYNDIPNYNNEYINNNEDDLLIDYTNYFKKCSGNINKTKYLENRGIDNRLFKKYNIGFDEEKNRIVFPINKNTFFARGIDNDFKMKSKGKSYLWNEKLLKKSNPQSLIYVTEGIIDALSLETINPDINVVSLNGLTNKTRLIELIKKENFIGNLVLVFDKDYAGINAQKELKNELDQMKINSFSISLISNFDNDCKDVNEALLKDKIKLIKNLNYFNTNLEDVLSKRVNSVEDDLSL